MQNTLKVAVLLVPTLLHFFVSTANAETIRSVSFGNYSIELPASMKVLPDIPAGAVLLAGTQETTYPTLNVIRISGKYDFKRPEKAQIEAILHSYKQVGLQTAAVTEGSLQHTRPPMFTAVLHYTSGKGQFGAGIFILPGDNEHFIGTYIYPLNQSGGKAAFTDLLETITGIEKLPASSSINPTPAKQRALLWALLPALILLTTVWLLFGRRIVKKMSVK